MARHLRSIAAMGDVDIASKAWLSEAAGAIARLVLGDAAADATPVGSITLPTTERSMDGLLRVRRGGRIAWLHVEVQMRWKANVPARAFEYWSRAPRRYRPLLSCVIVLKHDRRRGAPSGGYDVDWAGRPVLRFRFHVIRAWEDLDARELLGGPPALLPLVPFARGASTEAVEDALARLSAEPDDEHRAELSAQLAVNAGSVFPGVRWLGKIPEEILMKSSTIDELERRGALRGKREGIRQGKREGKREGIRQGKLELVATIFRKRLGSSFTALEAPLAGCDDVTLEQVIELAAGNLSRRPLRARLVALLKG